MRHRPGLILLGWLVLLAGAGCGTVSPHGTPSPAALQLATPSLGAPGRLVEQEPAAPAPAPAAELRLPATEERVARLERGLEAEEVTPAPRLAEKAGFIARDRVNLRPCPEENEQCGPVASLGLNEEVRVLGQDDAWLRVRVPRLNREGYVARRFVTPRPAISPAPAGPREERASAQVTNARKARDAGSRQDARGSRQAAPLPQEELIQ